jgi:hypothetical protein
MISNSRGDSQQLMLRGMHLAYRTRTRGKHRPDEVRRSQVVCVVVFFVACPRFLGSVVLYDKEHVLADV